MCIILELYIIYLIFNFTRKIILYVLAFLKLQNIYKGDFQTAVYGIPLRSPFRDIVVEKNRGEWKKNVSCSLAKLLRSLKKLCVPSQNVCVLSQNQVSSDKLFLFTLQLAVVTAPMFTMAQ